MWEKLQFDITQMDPERIRVEVYFKVGELVTELLGVLYYEKAKKSFNRKPVGLNAWACVDAKIEGLYNVNESITPPQLISHCHQLIKDGGY